MDMVMLTDKYPEFCKDLKELVAEGKVPMSRIDDAVTRILRVKFAMGLLDKDRSPLADRSLQKSFGSAEHRAVARQAVRESLVLLKNEKQTLPLAKTAARIHVAGVGADDLGMQCGGWTIDWQGSMGNHVPGGTTILTAIRNTVSKETKVTYSKDGTGAEGADVGVVVIGEKPYAEGAGDSVDLASPKENFATLANMKKAGIPLVVHRAFRAAGDPGRHSGAGPGAGGRLAAGLRGPGRGRRALRRLQADRQALALLAAQRLAASAERGRQGLRPVVSLRLRPELLKSFNADTWPRTAGDRQSIVSADRQCLHPCDP